MEELFEKVLFYIFIAFIVGLFIDLVIKLIGKVGKSNSITNQSTYTAKKENYRLLDVYDHFSSVLSNTFRFVDAYLQACPKEWLFVTVATVCEKGNFSTDTYKYYEEYIELNITVGSWFDNLLFRYDKDIEDYVKTLFEYNPSENEFKYRIRFGEGNGRMIPGDVVKRSFFELLDRYEMNNPNRKLNRTSFGFHNRWNLPND